MKTEELTPLLLDVVIQFLDTRPIGTKYHPRKNDYILDTRLLARVIRHGGNLMARVDNSENVFFSNLLQYLIRERTVKSCLHMGKYYCENVDGFTRMVIRVKKLGIFIRTQTTVPDESKSEEESKWASQTV